MASPSHCELPVIRQRLVQQLTRGFGCLQDEEAAAKGEEDAETKDPAESAEAPAEGSAAADEDPAEEVRVRTRLPAGPQGLRMQRAMRSTRCAVVGGWG
jgi:hypothetical protein